MGKTNYRSFSDRAEIAAFAEEQVEWIDLLTLAERRTVDDAVRSMWSAHTNHANDNEVTKVGK